MTTNKETDARKLSHTTLEDTLACHRNDKAGMKTTDLALACAYITARSFIGWTTTTSSQSQADSI